MAASGDGAHIPTDALGLFPEVPHLDNTFGAVLIGTFIGLILYGVTLHQSYRYFRMYPADIPILKFLVSFVLVLETFTSALSMHVCYRYLVSNYFNPLALIGGEWSLNLFPVLAGVVMVTTQSFFVRRVYLLGRRYRLFLAVAVGLCFVEMGFFIAATIKAFTVPTFEGFKHATWLVSTGSTMAVTSDIMITTMLISALRHSRTGVKRTDSMLDVMVMYSINTGLLTGYAGYLRIANLGSLLFAFIQPGTLIWAGVGIPGVKMYANTLMAALNSRRSLAAKGAGRVEDTSPFGVSRLPDSQEKSAPQPKAHHIEGWQVESESSMAPTDSVFDIIPSAPIGESPEDVRIGDIEKQGQA